MGWKYIMFERKIGDTTTLFPVIFPDKLVHEDVATGLRATAAVPGKPVSAGTIDHVEVHNLGGQSETLGLASNPTDARIIQNYAYCHGLK